MPNIVAGDIGGTNIRFALINKQGEILKKTKTRTPRKKEEIVETIFSLIEKVSEDLIPIIAIGVGGLVDFPRGNVVHSPNFDFSDVPLQNLVQKKFNIPCLLDNDANMAAWGEKVYGCAKNAKNFVCATLGTGIGAGLVLNNNIYRGSFSAAGEIGHMTIGNPSEVKGFGINADYESMASGSALGEFARSTITEDSQSLILELAEGNVADITGTMVTTAAKEGDETALKLLERQAELISIGLANIVNVLDPEIIVLSGGLALANELLVPDIKKSLFKRIFYPDYRKPEIVVGELGDDAGIIGGAAMAFYPLNK